MSDSRFSYRALDADNSRASSPASKLKLRKFGYKSALTVTDNFITKKFGPQMPLMVAECLAKSFNAKENSTVKFNDSYGWSWLVCGRKLFVWPLSENNGVPDENATIVGKDLMLPPSDLAYNADLAVVFKSSENQFVSCIAVSPEGVVRYWHTLRHYSNWVDVNCQLGGEEVCCVLNLPPLGCLAITTSASMILIEPREVEGTKTVSVNIITDHQSWLGGFGKKFSALLGYYPAPQFMESKGIKVIKEELDDDSWKVLLLAEHTLQHWLMTEGRYELLSEYNLKSTMKATFSEREEDPVTWEILDMKNYDSDSFMILAGSLSLRMIVIMKFSINELSEQNPQPVELYTLSQEDFRLLQCSSSQPLSTIKFLPVSSHCFVYSNKIVLSVILGGSNTGPSETVQFHNSYFLGGNMYSGIPVFFSTVHSYVSITPVSPLEAVDSSAVNSSFVMERENYKEASESGKHTEINSYNEAIKKAFLQHTKKNISQAKALIASTFSDVDSVDNSPLIKAILAVSEDIINQSSSRDPRLSRSTSNFSEVSSLHLDVQIGQKEEVHGLYVFFIKDIISPEKLGKVTYDGKFTKTMDVLSDHHERIIAARALYQLRTRFSTVIHQAISKVAENFNFPKDIAMINEEYFFTQVKYVFEGLKELCKLPEAKQKEGTAYDSYLKCVSDVNNILIDVLTKVIKTSEKKQFLNEDRNYIESLASSSGLFESLKNQATRTATIGIKYENTLENAHEYMNQLFSLSDIILFTQKNYASPEDFHTTRTSLIDYFVETKLFEQALMLAEKFTHYPTLVKICFLTNDVGRLNTYLSKYGDLGFCEELFKFYSNSRMYSHLMNLPLTPEFEDRLSHFLNDYPDISWIYAIKKHNYSKCFGTLSKLGSRENDYSLRKTRILSMAKLAREAGQLFNSDYDDYDLDTQLQLLGVQDELPQSLLANIGYTKKPIRTFSPVELIQLFICQENEEADEQHYKKALNLLPVISNVEIRDQLWEKIWERAVMTDRYSYQELGPPEQAVNQMLLFKLVNLIILTEDQPQNFIPNYKTLTSFKALEDISSDLQFKYVLRYGYEAFCESAGVHKSD